jgi:hypothetical protein
MANTGMQQKDISDLLKGQVNWTYKQKELVDARITRRRSKTEHHDDVPEVTYRLWPETAKLLETHQNGQATNDVDRMLLTAKGNPLVQAELRNGEGKRTDNVKSAYVRLLDKLKIPKSQGARKAFQLKLIRKTSASLLEKHPIYGRYANHFLADSPRSIPDSHYVVPDQKNFDDALDWLRQQILFEPLIDEAKPQKRPRAKPSK